MRLCVVRSCAKGVSGYSNLCNKHRINDRRNGSPLQRVVKATEVAKVAKHIERWIKGRSNQQVILDGMHKAWLMIIGDAKAELTRLERGGATHRDHIRAYSDIAKVGSEVKWETIALTCMAVSWMAGADRKLFDNDRCYYHALARRFRTLTDSWVATRWHHRTGKNVRIYCSHSPERLRYLGEVLACAFGPLGMSMQARVAQDEAEARRSRGATLRAISESCATAA